MRPSTKDVRNVAIVKGLIKRRHASDVIASFFNIDPRRVNDIAAGRTYRGVKARMRDLPDPLNDAPVTWYRPRVDGGIPMAGSMASRGKAGSTMPLSLLQFGGGLCEMGEQLKSVGDHLIRSGLAFTRAAELYGSPTPQHDRETDDDGRRGNHRKSGRRAIRQRAA